MLPVPIQRLLFANRARAACLGRCSRLRRQGADPLVQGRVPGALISCTSSGASPIADAPAPTLVDDDVYRKRHGHRRDAVALAALEPLLEPRQMSLALPSLQHLERPHADFLDVQEAEGVDRERTPSCDWQPNGPTNRLSITGCWLHSGGNHAHALRALPAPRPSQYTLRLQPSILLHQNLTVVSFSTGQPPCQVNGASVAVF
ncbi:hypothetical protein AURDEDRAFT_163824 [Auricularia subglabra TFB-10046 SS5]|nr:hypothetical protein AURDEDRAFT_163824 [Auricularia subglabra TFB-10046 SS5]